jgi:hypothetical protein
VQIEKDATKLVDAIHHELPATGPS